MSQEFRCSSAKSFWSQSLKRLQSRCWLRLNTAVIWIENLTGTGGYALKMAYLCGWEIGLGFLQENSVIGHTDLLSVFITWQLTFPRVRELREQSRNGKCFYDLALGIEYHYFRWILWFTQTYLILCRRGLHQGINTTKVRVTRSF